MSTTKLEQRRQEREEAFFLLFEHEFDPTSATADICERAKEARDLTLTPYMQDILDGVEAHKDELNGLIEKHSHGWKRERISSVAAAVMLLASYEMLYRKDIPVNVSLNEAVELMKKYDEDKARAFVNGVLNAIAKEIAEQ